MKINRNNMGHWDNPDFILCKASGERIGVLRCTAKTWDHKFNEVDTLSFEIPYMMDNEIVPFYEDIDVMKYVLVPKYGRFSIKDIQTENEGQATEHKEISCQSYECQLGQRYIELFSINEGLTESIDGVSFYSPGNQSHSLLHLVLEKHPEWSIAHVSDSLWSMKRSFNVTRQDVYSFLTKDVAEAFECIFIFDSINKTISAYTLDEYGEDTNIHLTFDSLLEKTQMDYSIDDIKTCITLTGQDDLSVREVNMGNDRLYNFSFYANSEYMSDELLEAYNSWQALVNQIVDLSLFTYKDGVITQAELQGKSYKDAYTLLLAKYQNYYTEISKWTSTLMPWLINTRYPGYGTISYTEDGTDAVTFERPTATVLVDSLPATGVATTLYLIRNTNNMYRWNGAWVDVNKWYNCNLATLKEKRAAAENLQAVAMKAGYGDAESTESRIQQRYIDTYLPPLYMINALDDQIAVVNATLTSLKNDQAIIQTDKTVIVNLTSMTNNFTPKQLKELSTFIREEELSSDNYLVTDVMTEDERFEMLYSFLEYGEKELAKVAQPQIQFSASMLNLFTMPEFDVYSGDFDIGNYVWVTIRDDYNVRAKLLTMHINFLDQNDFNVTFGNVLRKSKTVFDDVTDALNAASSAATSVSFNQSTWNASAESTDSIGEALKNGLLGQQYYLSNAEDNETLIDENGLWITTTTGQHGREQTDNYDAIYLGGGRILFTDDGWRSVSMSVGRADVDMPSIDSNGKLIFTKESLFGTFADFLIAGYVAGSTIVGGDIYSSNYKTSGNKNSGNAGTHINLNDGTFEFNSKTTGKKRLTLNGDTLEVNGVIQAQSGHIGCNDNGEGGFVIQANKMYNGKSSLTANARGVYVGTDGISLGTGNTFSVTEAGYITAISGNIGGATIASNSIHSGNGNWYINSDGTASFKHITISNWASINGVQWGSHFGSVGYDNGITWGSFGGTSFYGSNAAAPFQSNCVSHIQQISADYIYAKYLEAMYARIGNLEADNVTIHGTLSAHEASIGSLWAETANINSLVATKASISDLNAVNANLTNLIATKASITDLNAVNAKFSNLNASNITSGVMSTSYLSFRGGAVGSFSGYAFNDYPEATCDGKPVSFNHVSHFYFMGNS